ncbi:MAG: stage III sporulation protein SpoIIIAB [Clostridia bacterium]|nr:stage III sporulation protein SpoIIIAB [Clostridia bacterium]
MLLKIVGSILVICASSFLGFIVSKDYKDRPGDLRCLQGLLQIFENEISFLSSLLVEAFEKVSLSSGHRTGIFFHSTAVLLKSENQYTAGEAWEMAVRENVKKTSLNKEDEEILVSFGKLLGNSDIEGQLKNIKLTVSQLKMQEQKAEELRKKNQSMYEKLGILLGIAIVIVLI